MSCGSPLLPLIDDTKATHAPQTRVRMSKKMRIGEGTAAGDRVAGMDEQVKLERVYAYPFGDIYNNYLAKVERKGHTRAELDDVLGWFTGLAPEELESAAASGKTLREFFEAVALNANADLITGKVCGVRVGGSKRTSCARSARWTCSSTSWPAARRSPASSAARSPSPSRSRACCAG